MALTLGIITFLLASSLHFCQPEPFGFRNSQNSRNYRKDVRYGRPVLAMANSPRCTFNGKPVEDGKTISSPEPCLNCTCNKGILLCYLRTCSTIVAGPGCQTVRKPGTCCPQLECKDSPGYNDYRTERTFEPNNKFRFRQDDLNHFGLPGLGLRADKPTTSINSKSVQQKRNNQDTSPTFTAFLQGISSNRKHDLEDKSQYIQEEEYSEDHLLLDKDNSSGYCFLKGYKYTEGMAMLSSTKCEYCYCIRGQQMCVRPKCHLQIDGCVARYQSGYTCCPSHYQCDIDASVDDSNNEPFRTPGESHMLNKVTSCNVEGYDFDVGVAVPSKGHCQTCYCTQVGVVCRRLECSPTVPGCIPVIPEGHCCPTQYKCDHKNTTTMPISHSTDNYDVTVLSTSDSKGTSAQAPETSFPDEYLIDEENDFTTEENAGETIPDRHKITVELTEESDLESISVIPEENIAVLVLTTEKDEEEADQKLKGSSETQNEPFFPEKTTLESSNNFSLLKRKHKPTITSTEKYSSENSTAYEGSHFTRPLGMTTASHNTARIDTDYNDKDNYAYDYDESYDDTTRDVHETFRPFSDYSETTYTETETTKEEMEKTRPSNIKFKLKNKNPQLSTQRISGQETHFTTITDDSDKYKGTEPLNNDEYAYPETEEGIYSTGLKKYTIFTSKANEVTHQPVDDRTGVSLGTLKHRTRLPGQQINQKIRPNLNKPIITSENTYSGPTVPYEIDHEKSTHFSNTVQTKLYTQIPHHKTTRPHNKISSHRRQKPENPSDMKTTTKSSYTIPQDLANILWTITQSYKSKTAATSTESVSVTNTVQNITQGNLTQTSETLSPIALAAPKLILEDTTLKTTLETTETEIPDTSTKGVSPSFNFQAPEIIFSNHGPISNRKQPTYIHEPERPLIINNHKKTSIRVRPAIRPRPQTTPPIEETFVEISNHRPSNTFRRPPGKFPPYPHPVNRNRQEDGYYRDPHFRNSHHKFHRIESADHYKSSNDYEDYYYDENQEDQVTKKVFNNIKNQTTDSYNNDQMDLVTSTPLVTNKVDISSTDTTVTENNQSIYDSSPQSENKSTDMTVELPSERDVLDVTTEEYKEKTTETEIQTKLHHSTTPFPKSTYYLPPLTTMPPEIYTTKSFSGYVTNKHRLTDLPKFNIEAKLFRAEEDSKGISSSYIDNRFSGYNGKSSDLSNEKSDRNNLKSQTLPPEKFTQPPQSEEDSQEISDVCFVDGRYYTSGEIIVKSNPCEMCRCFYGHPLCQVQQCPPPPGPSCILEYLPGYCCPRVTCGIQTNPDEPPITASPPEPTSQEIKPPIKETDNQWKPLPHGPIIRHANTSSKDDNINYINKPAKSDLQIEIITKPIIFENPSNKRHEFTEALKEVTSTTEKLTEVSTTADRVVTEQELSTTSSPETTTLQQPTTTAQEEIPTTLPHTSTTISSYSTTTENSFTTPVSHLTITENPSTESTTGSVFPETSTLSKEIQLNPVFYSNSTYQKNEESSNKSTEIHDNSSGVRKILDDFITLPPFKVSLSPISNENISTVLPVIQTLSNAVNHTEMPVMEFVTLQSMDIADLPTELGGNLKVSGCNVYGKYYKINDKVEALNKPCTECICSADGIACNATC